MSASSCTHLRDKQCLEPFAYLNQIPGKDIRGALIDCFNEWLQLPNDKIVIIKEIISSLHNASLLVDDIEDNSKLRRGLPVAHSIFGIANTINCANYVYFLALQKCNELNNKDAMNTFVLELLNLHRGQGQDIIWRDSVRCPSEEQYKSMVLDKTGGLFRLAVGIMQPFCTACSDYNFTNLLNSLSLYFQIRDDFLNISNVAYMQTKSFCEDLTEGKFSFPIIHAVNSNPEDTQLLNILRQRTEDTDVKRYAVAYMENVGSIAYTRDTLKELRKQVENEIMSLGGHSNLISLITKLDEELDDNTASIKDIMTTTKLVNFPSIPSPNRVNSSAVVPNSNSNSNVSNNSKVSTL